MPKLALIGTLGVVALIAGVQLAPASEEEKPNPFETVGRQFTISPRSDVASITVIVNDMQIPPAKKTMALYGDDRFEYTEHYVYEAARSRDMQASRQLTEEDSRRLMQIATDGGLIGLTWEQLGKKFPGGRAPKYTDMPALRVRYQLDAYGDSGMPVDFTFECRCAPGLLTQRYPDIPELAALQNLLKAMGEIRQEVAQ